MKFSITGFLILLFACQFSSAQFLHAKTGTDIPMQYFIGFNYQQGKRISADLSGGRVTWPYNSDLYDVIRVPANYLSKKEFLQSTTDGGWVVASGINVNFGKWYGGLYWQRIQLDASGSYEYIINSDLVQEELTKDEKATIKAYLNSPLRLFVDLNEKIYLQSVIQQVGLKLGRRFFFHNPRFEFRMDLSLSQNIYAESTSKYDEGLLKNIISLEKQLSLKSGLSEKLDFDRRLEEFDSFYRNYAYIPTLNLTFTYLLFIPKKIKADWLESKEKIE